MPSVSARLILAQCIDQLAENPGDVLVLGQIGRPARVRQMDEHDALIFPAARAADEALALQRGEQLVHLAFEQARLRDQRRGGAYARGILRAEQDAEGYAPCCDSGWKRAACSKASR